jgi:hypothetical protein
MQDQPKYKPLAESRFFTDGRAARPIPEGTIARDELTADDSEHTGASGSGFLATIPVSVNRNFIVRGQDRFNIYCSPCHGRLGNGDGMVHRRGFWIPPTLHTNRLRAVAPGYLYQVIANGYGAMPSYEEQISVHDRWAIVAYIRALQLSRNAKLSDVPEQERGRLSRTGVKP